ncbi:MAG: hemolysin family protein, partial [Tannerellaceae bacterium]|nr:hemolysin family protein [Tannerellaceae bacterium]
NQYLSTMLVGNNIALVVYGLQMAILLEPYIARVVGNEALIVFIQSVISTLLILFTAEFLPKTVFKINPNLSLHLFAIPLYIFYIILYPISKFSSLLSFGILKVLGVRNLHDNTGQVLGRVDLDHYLQQSIDSAPENSDMDTEVKILQNALDFSSVRLRDCIVPRTEIVACDTATTVTELRSRFIETGLSKILVYNENIDDIIGYIHSSELFKNPEDWTQHIKTISIVPETMAANKLMKTLLQDKKSLAVVVDEFGGTAGIVTLEDLVEEIFGEIEDEHDTRTHVARKISENEYIISGRLEIDSLNEQFNLHIPEMDEYVTVAGFILHHYQKFPKLNEIIVIDNYHFKILKVTSTKIELVRLQVIES